MRQQAHHRIGGHGFARAALADDAQDLAGGEVIADIVDRERPVGAGGQGQLQAADRQQRVGTGLI